MADISRSYPVRPVLAVSAAIFRHGRVLLGERATAPAGIFSLPGGVVEVGETMEQAVYREVAEETGLAIGIEGFVGHHEVIRRDEAGLVKQHFMIAVFWTRAAVGEPVPSAEMSRYHWVEPKTLDGLLVTEGLAEIVSRALLLSCNAAPCK